MQVKQNNNSINPLGNGGNLFLLSFFSEAKDANPENLRQNTNNRQAGSMTGDFFYHKKQQQQKLKEAMK